MYNQTILNLISNDPQTADRAYHDLRREWPQINDKTTVRFVDSYTVNIATSRELPIQAYNQETWGAWWRGLFRNYFSLDDPDDRWRYSKSIVRSIRKFPVLIWRTLTGQMPKQLPPEVFRPQIETLRMKQFGWPSYSYGRPDPNVKVARLACVYYAPQDMLYVYDKNHGLGRLDVKDRDQVVGYAQRYERTTLDSISPDVEAALREALERYKKP